MVQAVAIVTMAVGPPLLVIAIVRVLVCYSVSPLAAISNYCLLGVAFISFLFRLRSCYCRSVDGHGLMLRSERVTLFCLYISTSKSIRKHGWLAILRMPTAKQAVSE